MYVCAYVGESLEIVVSVYPNRLAFSIEVSCLSVYLSICPYARVRVCICLCTYVCPSDQVLVRVYPSITLFVFTCT